MAAASVPLDIRFSGKPSFRSVREREEALSLIRRLLAKLDLHPDVITLEAMHGGRSSSLVFKLTPHLGKTKSTPIVVKIGPRADGLREKANYEKYVRNGIPPACRPELLAFAKTRTRTALCYSFAGNRDGSRLTLTQSLQQGDVAKIDLVLSGLFASLHRSWYSRGVIRGHRDICGRYLKRFFGGPHHQSAQQDETALAVCAARYFKARKKDGGYVIGGEWFPSPYKVLFASGLQLPWHSCILHGDLNTDNILIGEGGGPDRAGDRTSIKLIDFLHTGRGHVFEDLASVEQSIRINYPPHAGKQRALKKNKAFSEILETERAIALRQPQKGKDPYAASIRKVRAAAVRYFGKIEDDAAWDVTIAALGLRLMQATDLTHVARARIVAAALWSAKVLADEHQSVE